MSGAAPARVGRADAQIDAGRLAALLGLPDPTPEQAAAIEAPLAPAVIIAGAGSGKTETMASRVVWLVANGLIVPERVLGLTFTRKAAAELAIRIRARLAVWRRYADPRREDPALDGEPTVLTYAAYASRLVGEHALRVGAEPDALVLSEARRWQIADEAVRRFDGSLADTVGQPPTVTRRTLELAGELAEHLRGPEDVEALTADMLALLEPLPAGSNRVSKRWPWDIERLVNSLEDRRSLLPLVRRFADAKARIGRGGMDFGDQMALAARLAQIDEVRALERDRHAVVLLDEYQDTGHAQSQMLHGLFGDGHPVTAVGDPYQAIYGWRGASAGTMDRFARRFARADGAAAAVLTLSTSFRNAASILYAANDLAGPLSVASPDAVELRPRPGAPAGEVQVAYLLSVEDEAQWIAARIGDEWRARAGTPRTAAVLVRRRAQIPLLEQALTAAGLPVEVVGLGGLLSTPEVTEVVATLRVLHDHGAGASLMRLLTGPRWRIGPSDLAALWDRARFLGRPMPGVPAAPDDAVGLVEALDDLGPADRYSPAGYARMHALGSELAYLRRRSGIGLPELVAEAEQRIGVGIEVAARPDRARTARAHLDRFLDEVTAFSAEADLSFAAGTGGPPGLGALLAYLDAVEREEYGGEAGEVEVAPERVQILTVHGAKGLEWDVVAIAGLVDKTFPAQARDADWTRTSHRAPNPLRGDADDLPQLDLEGVLSLKDVKDRMEEHQVAVADRHALEERRLAYVALTRAREALFLAGAAWSDGAKPREPADFLVRLRELAEDPPVESARVESARVGAVRVAEWVEDPGERNPLLLEPQTGAWPFDPLGSRRVALEDGAALVRAALRAPAPTPDGALGGAPGGGPVSTPVSAPVSSLAAVPDAAPTGRAAQWAQDVDTLLRERAALARGGDIEVPMPGRLSVSQLVTLRRDPAELARQIRRPMPSKPAPLARRGTAFHLWLERRWDLAPLVDIDELPGSADPQPIDDDDVEALRAAFERSEWASRQPAEVESPFDAVIGGIVVRGRIDAVFRDADAPDGSPRWSVVDWKTGAPPTGEQARAAAVQLAAYRIAWADLHALDPAAVRAAFHYVRAERTVWLADPPDRAALAELIEQASG